MAVIRKYNNSSMTIHAFWQCIEILLSKPHVINKRLWGSKMLNKCKCIPVLEDWTPPQCCNEIGNVENVNQYLINLQYSLELKPIEPDHNNANIIEIILVELLPKSYTEKHAFQTVFLQKDKACVKFYDVTPKNEKQNLCPEFSYSLQFYDNEIVLTAECDPDSKSYQWLNTAVMPQFLKWGKECSSKSNKQNICTESLSLVSNDKYYKKYNELKLKYGKEMVKIWPECTDPSKFVYEDVAIATYLLLLWEETSGESCKQTFIDLGCGNGLLVYILAKEGHHGIGIDVRKRQIWDMYPDDVKLEERTIIPSDVALFPEADWIIGNHSDELTPWIPVIAARSSYKCKFFLLPCCAYNFDGSKYQRQNSSKSQYTEYLEYVKSICDECGYETYVDRLKIPSTKRICLVGKQRQYPEADFSKYCISIQTLIDNSTNSVTENNENDTSWVKDFKPRESTERVRNCTQIDKTLISSIVNCIASYLLEGCNLAPEWSLGKNCKLSELIQLISEDKLKALKSECGGLQTLLRNNHQIFKVQNGEVQLCYPKSVAEVTKEKKGQKAKNIKIQEKPCWFYNNHPKGCPLIDVECSFLHIKE